MEHLMDPMDGMSKTLGNPPITPELKRMITEGVLAEGGSRIVEQLARRENTQLEG